MVFCSNLIFTRDSQPSKTQPCLAILMGALLVFLTGCATSNPVAEQTLTPQSKLANPIIATSFSSASLYDLLAAELLGLQGDVDSAFQGYLAQAFNTRSPRVAERATDIARLQSNLDHIAESSALWFALEPSNPNPALIHFSALVSKEQFDEAHQHLVKSLKTLDSQTFFEPLQGHISATTVVNKQNYLTVFETFLAAPTYRAQLSPSDRTDVLLMQSVVHLQLQDTESALSTINQALEQTPNYLGALSQKLDILIAQKNYPAANNTLKHSLELYPDDPTLALFDVKLNLIELKQNPSDQQKEQASKLATQYLDNHQPNSSRAFYLGRLLFDAALYDEAQTVMEDLLAQSSHNFRVQLFLGLIAIEKGRIDAAKEHLLAVMSPTDIPVAAYHLSQIITTEDEKAAFQNWLYQARERLPSYAANLFSIEVDWLSFTGFHDEAYAIANEAIERYPSNVNLLFMRVLMDLDSNFVQAEQDLRSIIALEPDNVDALNTLGYYLTLEGQRLDEAQVLLEQVLAISPNTPAYIDSMGWLKFKQGHFLQAVEYLERAYSLDTNLEILSHLVQALWQAGQQEQAQQLLSPAIAEHPEDTFLQEAIKLIEDAT